MATCFRAALALAVALAAPAAQGRDEPPHAGTCSFPDRAGEFRTQAGCMTPGKTGPRVAAAVLKQLGFDASGLAPLHADGVWHYVRKDGLARAVATLDNGPDPFNGGLARGMAGGKYGFIDTRLDFVIPPEYDGAYPFAASAAAVCIGCARVVEGEVSRFEGGRWQCLDTRGAKTAAGRCPVAGFKP